MVFVTVFFIHSFIAVYKVQYVENVDSQALDAVGKVVRF